MRDTFKKEKGITLITLAITIVVLLILASVSINYSFDAIDHSHYMAMHSEIQVIQEKINVYYSEKNEITGVQITDDQKVILQNKGVNESNYSDYYYFSATHLRDILGINSIEGDYLISVKNRDIICLSTIKIQGKSHVNYRYEEIADGYNVEYEEL